MANENQNSITIDIQDSLYAKHFDTKNLIHKEEFDTLRNAIVNRIANNNKKESEKRRSDSEERRSETFTVLGTRGSGKSSFLYSLLHWCKEGKQKDNIQVLDLIDPTLFESKGHIMLTIIAQLKHLIDERNNSKAVDNEYCVNYKEWDKRLESLARGIPSIKDDDFIKDNWMEPRFVMNQGILDVYSAYTLEKSFNEFVDSSLKFLGKTLLVIVFDDIDIDFRRGWEVLETVRKYLTSPQIFVIISGDIRLFSKSIRKVQWKNFGKALLKNESDEAKDKYYNNLVTEMESQYLQKILPTQYRINLMSLLDIVDKSLVQVKVKYSENESKDTGVKDDGIVVRKYYGEKLFEGYEFVNPVQIKVFVDYLLSMPLRTQMQLMFALSKVDEQPRNLIMPFASYLLDNGINYDDLIRFPNKLNAIIIKFLISKQIVEENYQLQPNTLDVGINACLVALSLVSSRHYKWNAYLVFDYIVRVGYIRYLKYASLQYASEKLTSDDKKRVLEDFVKHTQLYNDIDLKVSIGNAIAYLDGIDFKGATKIYGFAEKAKEGFAENRIDTVFNNKSIQRTLGFLPLTISMHTDKQSSELNYSVVALLAAITDIVREASSRAIDKENIIDSDRGKTILEFLNYLSQTRNYMIPVDGGTDNGEAVVNETSGLSIDRDDEGVADFVTAISEWIENYNDSKVVLPPYLLGKIATRAYAAINSLDPKNDLNLGDAMHRRIVIFLNAVLVEEAREYGYNLNNNNPSGSDKIFEDNLKKFKKDTEKDTNGFDIDKLQLFIWIIKCPLLLAYLNLPEDGELVKAFGILFGQINDSIKDSPESKVDDYKFNIYSLLEQVAVKNTAETKRIRFSSSSKECINILKANFKTPDELFAGSDEKQVKNKLKKYFDYVYPKSVNSLINKYSGKSKW